MSKGRRMPACAAEERELRAAAVMREALFHIAMFTPGGGADAIPRDEELLWLVGRMAREALAGIEPQGGALFRFYQEFTSAGIPVLGPAIAKAAPADRPPMLAALGVTLMRRQRQRIARALDAAGETLKGRALGRADSQPESQTRAGKTAKPLRSRGK